MEIVDFSQVLQQSTSGRSLGDEILASVVRSGIIAAAMISRDVRTEASSVPGTCTRWLAQPGNDDFVVGLSEEDAAGFTEIFFGAYPLRDARTLSPVERRVLGVHLAVFVSPLANAVERPTSPDIALVDVPEPPEGGDWTRFAVTYTIDDVPLAVTIATRDGHTSGRAGSTPVLDDIPVEAEVALRNITMTWGALATMKVGDVVSCSVAESQPIRAWIGNGLAFDGHVVAQGHELVYEIRNVYLEQKS